MGLLPLYPLKAEEDASSEGGNSSFAVFLFEPLGWIWLYNNTYLHYGAYPYYPGGYIQRPRLPIIRRYF
jgi:hypothetical protein